MASTPWDDRTLYSELAEALREAGPVPAEYLAAARAAWTWRTVDAELALAELTFDSACDPAAAGPVRSGGRIRTLTFRGPALAIEIEITEVGIAGQVIPAAAGQVVGLSPAGPFGSAPIDEVGCFLLDPAPPGPVRLRTRVGTVALVTSWVTLNPGPTG